MAAILRRAASRGQGARGAGARPIAIFLDFVGEGGSTRVLVESLRSAVLGSTQLIPVARKVGKPDHQADTTLQLLGLIEAQQAGSA